MIYVCHLSTITIPEFSIFCFAFKVTPLQFEFTLKNKTLRWREKKFLDLHVIKCDKYRNLHCGWICKRGAIECGLPFNSAPGKE